MKCSKCPYHRYEVGLEDADEYCEVFNDFPDDDRLRKDEEGCIFNLRTLAKYKRLKDQELEAYMEAAAKRAGIEP